MKFSVKKLLYVASTALILNQAHATSPTCPSIAQIQTVQFVRAYDYDIESRMWELTSAPFMHEGKMWSISFGATISEADTSSLALKYGSQRYREVSAAIQAPPVDPIPAYLFCDYTHAGQDYWIQAFSPAAA